MNKEEMLDYLLSTGLYDVWSKKRPYASLYNAQRMMDSDKTVPVKELVERFIRIDKACGDDPWNIKQILANIDMIVPVEDR